MVSKSLNFNGENFPVERDKNSSGRLLAIDGLRGLAALGVVLFHLSGNMNELFHRALPDFLEYIFKYGYLGVPVFFILSGFVISHAIGNRKISFSYIGLFIVRRSIRLDPPYWAAIILAIVMLVIKHKFLNSPVDIPTFSEIFFHIFYLQDLLHINPVLSPVFWTLCLEIQFYLFFVFSIYCLGLFPASYANEAEIFFLLCTGLLSLLIYIDIISLDIKGAFFPYWHFFVSGIILQRTYTRYSNYQLLMVFWLCLILAFSFLKANKSYLFTELAMIVFIYCMGLGNYLKDGLSFKSLQFFGAISYSLYLIHPEIGWKIISVLQLVFKNQQSLAIQIAIFLSGLVGSILCAYFFYLTVEKTSMRLARKVVLKN